MDFYKDSQTDDSYHFIEVLSENHLNHKDKKRPWTKAKSEL